VSKQILDIIVFVTTILVFFTASRSKPQDLKIVRENWRYYVLFPDGKKVEIVKVHEGGAPNVVIVSPDSKYVFYTTGNWIGFESSGKDLFYCRPDGSERTFLRKMGESVKNVHWIKKDGHNYILFSEVAAGLGWETTDLFDLDSRRLILRIDDWKLERIDESNCFTITDYSGKLKKGSKICLDSLLSLSDPDKYKFEIYYSNVRPDLFFLSTRLEPFLDPAMKWYNGDEDEIVGKIFGGIGHFSSSPDKKRTAYWINMNSKSWIGVLNSRTNLFQYSDSMTEGEYKYNLVWSDNDNYLGFVKKYPDNYQEVVILEFLGDSSCTIREELKLKEETEVELVGWSTRKNGFYYMIGKKEFLKLQE